MLVYDTDGQSSITFVPESFDEAISIGTIKEKLNRRKIFYDFLQDKDGCKLRIPNRDLIRALESL